MLSYFTVFSFRYDFVRRLKSKMEMSLGCLIEDEIQKHSIAPNDTISGNETVVSKITNMILNSKEYAHFKTIYFNSELTSFTFLHLYNYIS